MRLNIAVPACAAFVAPFLLSCGGARPALQGVSGQSKLGRASMTIKWPVRNARIIPTAANSIVVQLSQNGKQVATSGALTRPAGGGTTTWTTPNLDQGTYSISATAFPNADGSGTAQARGSGSITISYSSIAQASVTMGSTVTNVTLSPPALISRPGFQSTVTASATDASGAIVLVAPSDLTWKTSDPTTLEILSQGISAKFQALKNGSPYVTCVFTGVESTLGQQPVSSAGDTCTIATPGPASSWPVGAGTEGGNATTSAPGLLNASVAWTSSVHVWDVLGIAPDGSVLGVGDSHTILELNPDGTTKWDVAGPSGGGSAVIASDGSICFGGTQTISLCNGVDGSLAATYNLPSSGMGDILLGPNGTIYWFVQGSGTTAAPVDGTINALNPDGTTWSTTLTGALACPPVMDPKGNIYGLVYQANPSSGILTSVAPNGNVNWSVSIGAHVMYSGANLVYSPTGTLYVSTNLAFVENENYVVAVSTSGNVLWQSQPIGNFCVDSQGNLYSPSTVNNYLVKVDAGSGTVSNLAPLYGAYYGITPSISSNNEVYVWFGSAAWADSSLYAYSPSGSLVWSVAMTAYSSGQGTGEFFPAIGPDGSVYIVDYGNVLYKITGATSAITVNKGRKPIGH